MRWPPVRPHAPGRGTVPTRGGARDTGTPRQRTRRFTRRTHGVAKANDGVRAPTGVGVCPLRVTAQTLASTGTNAGADPWRWSAAAVAPRHPSAGRGSASAGLDDGGGARVSGPIAFLDPLRTIDPLFPAWHGVHHSNCGTLPYPAITGHSPQLRPTKLPPFMPWTSWRRCSETV